MYGSYIASYKGDLKTTRRFDESEGGRRLNDPYELNELNLPLTDHYSAGILDMGGEKLIVIRMVSHENLFTH